MLQTIAFLGFALSEALALIGLVLAFVIIPSRRRTGDTHDLSSWLIAAEPAEPLNPLIPHAAEIIVGDASRSSCCCSCCKRFVFPMFEKTLRGAHARRSRGASSGPRTRRPRRRGARAIPAAAGRGSRRGGRDPHRGAGRAGEHRRGGPCRGRAAAAASRAAGRRSTPSGSPRAAELSREVGRIAVELAGQIVGERLSDDARRTGNGRTGTWPSWSAAQSAGERPDAGSSRESMGGRPVEALRGRAGDSSDRRGRDRAARRRRPARPRALAARDPLRQRHPDSRCGPVSASRCSALAPVLWRSGWSRTSSPQRWSRPRRPRRGRRAARGRGALVGAENDGRSTPSRTSCSASVPFGVGER